MEDDVGFLSLSAACNFTSPNMDGNECFKTIFDSIVLEAETLLVTGHPASLTSKVITTVKIQVL